MNKIWKQLSLIFVCALFNLLFEYSARGIGEFTQRPLLVIALFGIYFSYFTMLEDLVVRFKLKNYEIFLMAFAYGLFPIAFLTGNLFNQEIYSGIMLGGVNIGTVIIIGILAWGVVQGMVTLYLGNRLSPRNWDHPHMGKTGWILALLYQAAVMIYASTNPRTPRGEPLGYLVFGVLVIAAAVLLIRSLKTPRPQIRTFQSSWIMDLLAFGSVLIFLILGTFFVSGPTIVTSQPLNLVAVTIENIWVFICGVVFFLYRFWKRSDVAV
ncbi:MAG: hypothetical protein MUO76_15430 [Anaerolineaceae bacterium]|nr:hypothetical protein [Anaerolineaceae bacterium]